MSWHSWTSIRSDIRRVSHDYARKTNCNDGDLRFEPTPGQWQAVPKQLDRTLDEKSNTITTKLCYPDKDQHLTGFNPLLYPDFEFTYEVRVHGEGGHIVVSVDLDRPVPEEFLGKLCFNLELVPHILFGKPWIMDQKQGIFPDTAKRSDPADCR